jgi:hypothetical protein
MSRGVALKAQGDGAGELAEYGRAIEIREKLRAQLGEQFPPEMAYNLGKTYMNRGAALISHGDVVRALTDYGLATAMLEKLREQLGERFSLEMANSLAKASSKPSDLLLRE